MPRGIAIETVVLAAATVVCGSATILSAAGVLALSSADVGAVVAGSLGIGLTIAAPSSIGPLVIRARATSIRVIIGVVAGVLQASGATVWTLVAAGAGVLASVIALVLLGASVLDVLCVLLFRSVRSSRSPGPPPTGSGTDPATRVRRAWRRTTVGAGVGLLASLAVAVVLVLLPDSGLHGFSLLLLVVIGTLAGASLGSGSAYSLDQQVLRLVRKDYTDPDDRPAGESLVAIGPAWIRLYITLRLLRSCAGVLIFGYFATALPALLWVVLIAAVLGLGLVTAVVVPVAQALRRARASLLTSPVGSPDGR